MPTPIPGGAAAERGQRWPPCWAAQVPGRREAAQGEPAAGAALSCRPGAQNQYRGLPLPSQGCIWGAAGADVTGASGVSLAAGPHVAGLV